MASILNADVLALICDQFEMEIMWGSRDSRKTLLSLALTSKDFSSPALNVLWRNLYSLEPLLSILPETILLDGKKMLVKQIEPSSWDRLHFYTSRVRKFDQTFDKADGRNTVHESVLARLGERAPIFPNLRDFRPSSKLASSNSLLFFLTGTISGVQFCYMSSPQPDVLDLGSSLALLASKSPGIKSLMLHARLPYSGFRSSLSCFTNLSRLTVSRLPHYEADFLRGIASLTKLTYLYIELVPFSYTGIHNRFPSLKELHLKGSSTDFCDLLSIITSSSVLQHLSLQWSEDGLELAELDAVYSAVIHFSSTLRVLYLGVTPPVDLAMGNDVWTVFTSLFRLTQLQTLAHGFPMSLTDDQTAKIASAWPHMESLSFSAKTWEGRILPPVDSLVHFARHCPKLVFLSYPIKLDAPLKPAILPVRTLSMHPLQTFGCNLNYAVTSPVAIALRLHLIFPNLQYLEGYGDGWDNVQDILDSYHLLEGVRAQV